MIIAVGEQIIIKINRNNIINRNDIDYVTIFISICTNIMYSTMTEISNRNLRERDEAKTHKSMIIPAKWTGWRGAKGRWAVTRAKRMGGIIILRFSIGNTGMKRENQDAAG
jgi:hypothetical protein